MLKIFRGSSGLQLVLILLAAVALWMPALIHPRPMPAPEPCGPMYSTLYRLFQGFEVIPSAVAFLLLLGEAIILNNALARLSLLPRNSYITAFIFVILMSSWPAYLTLHPMLFSAMFVILSMRMLLRIYDKEDPFMEVLNAGLFLAIATMFSVSALPIFFLIWICLIVFRIMSWREWAISVIGFALPFAFLLTYYYVSDSLTSHLADYKMIFSHIGRLGYETGFSTWNFIYFGLLALIALMSVWRLITTVGEKNINLRKIFLAVFWMFFLSLSCLMIGAEQPDMKATMAMLPLSIMLAHNYIVSRKMLMNELLFLLFITAIILQKFL
ncbi:MAG: DUF6427 family protein [Bacteroidota bacterium]